MKKIINNKMYNTDTAEEITYYTASRRGFSASDFRYYTECLYRKKTGEYFLHGEGGPLTKYARSVGLTGSTGGENIIPLSLEETKDYLVSIGETELYCKLFGEPEE